MKSAIFLEWFRYAVDRVGPGYWGHVERVYCYELYHYIRVAMHHHERTQGKVEDIFLHSELVKTVLSENDAQRYDVWPLGARRMPDFLFHTPDNFNNQIAAIEVKTAYLSQDKFIEDLEKLTELYRNYKYQLAIFHCTNTSIDRIRHLLKDISTDHIEENIKIECKEKFNEPMISMNFKDLKT